MFCNYGLTSLHSQTKNVHAECAVSYINISLQKLDKNSGKILLNLQTRD